MRRLLLSVLLLAACDRDEPIPPGDPEFVRDPALDVELVSAPGGTTSHNEGQNCMECHQAKGPAPGRFSVAGTVFDGDGTPSPDAVVELWTEPAGQGELLLRVEADALGNFYTTAAELVLTERPAFPYVRAEDGVRANLMPFPTMSGACNVCHSGSNPVDL